MPNTLTQRRFQQLTVVNSGWALLIGVLTITLKVLIECPTCHPNWLTWGQPVYWSSTLVGLLLASAVTICGWYNYRHHGYLMVATLLMVLTLLFELLLGALTTPNIISTVAHTVMVTFYFSFTLLLATLAYAPPQRRLEAVITTPRDRYYFNALITVGIATLLLLISGVLLKTSGAASACLSWPLCEGRMFSQFTNPSIGLNLLHRFSVLVVGIVTMGLVLQTRRNYKEHRQLVQWSNIVTALFLAQVGVGALYAIIPATVWINLLHLSLSVAMWGGVVVLATIFYFADKPHYTPLEIPTLTRKAQSLLYFKLIKPFVLILLLVTTIIGMIIAAKGMPSVLLMMAVFWGGVFSAGGASVLNNYIDSDIDGKMSRTSRRGSATGLIPPEKVLTFGLILSALSIITFVVLVNPLSAFLSLVGLLYYVFFYTMYLKRNTIHNIVVGGAAGAIPPLVGWAAIDNTLNLEAFYLFAIIFFWTPPHTWAMALLVKKDYARVKVPMLPVIVGEQETVYQTFLYSILMVAITFLPVSFGMAGWLYFGVLLLLNARFTHLAWALWRNYTKATSKRLYKYSQSYLALLFLAMAIDRILLG